LHVPKIHKFIAFLKACAQNNARLKLVRRAQVADPCYLSNSFINTTQCHTLWFEPDLLNSMTVCIVWYNVFTPTRNAVDSSIHATNKEHKYLK